MLSLALSRNIHSIKLMTDYATTQGISQQSMLKGTGLTEAQLLDANMLVSGHQELQLVRNLVEHLGDRPGLGLVVGARYHFTTFGAFGIALVSSASVREALRFALEYFALTFAFTQFVVREQHGETYVYIEDEGIPAALKRFIIERDVAALLSVQRDLIPDNMFKQLAFSFKADGNPQAYSNFFGIEPQFAAAKSYAILDAFKIDQPLQLANELVLQAAAQQCQQILDQRRSQQKLTCQLQQLLMQAKGHMPSMETIAAQLHMNSRTMRRHLANEGTTFIQIREEVRQLLADHYLALPNTSIEHIADWLGYSESASFISAYKRWKGNTPHAQRLNQKNNLQ